MFKPPPLPCLPQALYAARVRLDTARMLEAMRVSLKGGRKAWRHLYFCLTLTVRCDVSRRAAHQLPSIHPSIRRFIFVDPTRHRRRPKRRPRMMHGTARHEQHAQC